MRMNADHRLCPAVILAGGDGTRLGGADKALLRLGAQTLLDIVLAALGPQAARIAISAQGDAARFNQWGLDVLEDGAWAGRGPLAGVLAGLIWAQAQGGAYLITVPVDTPFIPADLATRFAGKSGGRAAVACSAGRVHHLVACWPVACISALQSFLRSGESRVRHFTEGLDMTPVTWDTQPDPFGNINTPDDLAAALQRLGGACHE